MLGDRQLGCSSDVARVFLSCSRWSMAIRLEKARLGTVAGKAKVAGTLMGIGGAMLLTFYKGVEVNLWSTHVNLLRHVGATQQGQEGSSNLPLGSLLAVASCFCYALWLIIQVGLCLFLFHTSSRCRL